ncbi:MAG: hypothetical protein JO229_12235, partial [Alphaproteobacteria bacterium]|nr:hypothetical protein [Alphaproteobacteria bacterium]
MAEPYSRLRLETLARSELARAMVTRAALRQAAGDIAAPRLLLDEAAAIFQELGTLDEPTRVARWRG